MMGEDEGGGRQDADVALEVLLGMDVCRKIDEEKEEEEEIVKAEGRMIFDHQTRTINFAKRRATDCKGNTRVFFPRRARAVEVETGLQAMRDLLMTVFGSYT